MALIHRIIEKFRSPKAEGAGPQLDDFDLLPDRPIEADRGEDIKFGHGDIAGTIFKTVEKVEPPFTIGLYGQWGVGKTTISGIVEKEAKKNGYATFYFDVWKYERDSLRRQFLIELDKRLNLGLSFKTSLNQSLSINDPTKGAILFDWKVIFNKIGFVFLTLIAAGAVGWLFGVLTAQNWLAQLSSIVTTLGLSGILIQSSVNAIARIQQTATTVRTDSAEGFEDRFKEALEKITQRKILVIIDNLDRIEDRKMVEVLSDIKTFLSKDGDGNKVVFLIPCDDGALRSQLLSTYGANFDADEFLRKFFNFTFSIPKFIDLDLDDYVRELLKQIKVREFQSNRDLEGIIIYAFRDNPREIKQFINSLVVAYLLAKKRDLRPVISNPAFLAKILAIRQKFPAIYDILEEFALRSTINFKNNNLDFLIDSGLQVAGLSDDAIRKDVVEKFNFFNSVTESVDADEIDVFFGLNQSQQERSVPESKNFILALEEQRKDDAKKALEEIQKAHNEAGLDEILRDRIKRFGRGVRSGNVIATALPIFWETHLPMPQFCSEIALYLPTPEDMVQKKEDFDPEMLLEYLYPSVEKSRKHNVINAFIALISLSENGQTILPDEYAQKCLKALIKNKEKFLKDVGAVRAEVEKSFSPYRFLSLFDSEQLQTEFLNSRAKERFINSIDPSRRPFPELPELSAFWSSLSLDSNLVSQSLTKIVEFLNNEAATQSDRRNTIVSLVEMFLRNQKIEYANYTGPIQHYSDMMSTFYNQAADDSFGRSWDKREVYLSAIKCLAMMEGNPRVPTLLGHISSFVSSAPVENLDSKSEEFMSNLIPLLPDAFAQRCIAYPDLFKKLHLEKYLPNPNIQQVVNNFISTHPENALEILKTVNYKTDQEEAQITNMIQRIDQIPMELFDDWTEAIIALGVEHFADKINALFEKLKIIKAKGGSYKDSVLGFVMRHKAIFNPGQLEELEKEESEN